jgi:hypothetical protein
MELFILILPISGVMMAFVSKEIFPPYHLQQYTFDRISKGNCKKSVNENGGQDRTDDNLEETKIIAYLPGPTLVTGFLDGEEINIIVNHWPSRSGGEKKSSPFREAAGTLNRK